MKGVNWARRWDIINVPYSVLGVSRGSRSPNRSEMLNMHRFEACQSFSPMQGGWFLPIPPSHDRPLACPPLCAVHGCPLSAGAASCVIFWAAAGQGKLKSCVLLTEILSFVQIFSRMQATACKENFLVATLWLGGKLLNTWAHTKGKNCYFLFLLSTENLQCCQANYCSEPWSCGAGFNSNTLETSLPF